jgi:phospholipid/cholesterol/gamma-HCH transport system permease protein
MARIGPTRTRLAVVRRLRELIRTGPPGRTHPQNLDARFAASVERLGDVTLLATAVLRVLLRPRTWFAATLQEASRQAGDALPLAVFLAALGGALISQQTGYQFQGTLPPWVVGSIVAASAITELAPLFAGFALVGTVGTRIAAEVAAMRATQQIDALEVMSRDPVEQLIAPRVLAGALVGPLIMCFALVSSMLAGWAFALLTTRAATADFWFGVRHYMRDFPLFYALIKGWAFGVVITFTACYAGLQTRGGSAGVGRSVCRGVMWMIAAIIFTDTALIPLLKLVRI